MIDFDIRAIASLGLTFARQHQSGHEKHHAENRQVHQQLRDPLPRLLSRCCHHAAFIPSPS
jgi:hypothetical protein